MKVSESRLLQFASLLALSSLILICCPMALCQQPEKVELCQLVAERGRYNHKLIEVEGFVSHGFEDFTLFEPGCSSQLDVWLEYGGTARSGTIYCCGAGPDRTRPETLKIEGIPVDLIQDQQFHEFDRLIQRRPDSVVRATLVGWFFSGKRQEITGGLLPGGYRWEGFGHMGCCSLLAIQQVISVDSQLRKDLDYRAFPDDPEIDKLNCGYQDLVSLEPYHDNLEAQRRAESGQEKWAFTDSQQVASTSLASLLKVSKDSITGIKKKQEAQGRIVYEWHPGKEGAFYMVVVSRPYWLSFVASDSTKVAWVAIAAYKVCD